jgi:S-adenosylmethionine:tRNA ribosyltransferase-isomerase
VIAAGRAVQRRPEAKLLAVDTDGRISHHPRSSLTSLLHRGDLLVVNDAATLPASLTGAHERTGRTIEVRLAGCDSLMPTGPHRFLAVVFGDGDFHTRTEDRPAPPALHVGDRLALGQLRATIVRLLDHPRLAVLAFDGTAADLWTGLAWHGRPIQYAHLQEPLALWDTWTTMAATPAAFEPPSAGFVISWRVLAQCRASGIEVASLTHAAGISSTGDAALDARLPFDEPYRIPLRTSTLIDATRKRGRRVIAVGTTVTRALEHAAGADRSVAAGSGLATGRIDGSTSLRVVNALISGTHEAGTSHHRLLQAFVGDVVLGEVDRQLNTHGYLTHEFGDSIFAEAARCAVL